MLQTILAQILFALPSILAWLVGAVIAIVTWQKHPRLSMLVLITFLLFIFFQIINDIVVVLLPRFTFTEHMDFQVLTILEEALYIVLFIPLWGLVIWAIFGWRKAAPGAPVFQAQQQWPQAYPQPPLQAWQPQSQSQQPQAPFNPNQPQNP